MVNNLPAVQGRPRFNPWVRKILGRRAWQRTPVFLLGEFHGQRSLVGLQSMDSERVRQDSATNTFTFGGLISAALGCTHVFRLLSIFSTLDSRRRPRGKHPSHGGSQELKRGKQECKTALFRTS